MTSKNDEQKPSSQEAEIIRKTTIAGKIIDTIPDAKHIRSDNRMKYTKHEMVPPLTVAYRQLRTLREIEETQSKLEREIEVSDKNCIKQQKKTEEILKKQDELKEMFDVSEKAHDKLEKEKEEHFLATKLTIAEVQGHDKEIKRYSRAALSIGKLRKVLESVIQSNKCYVNFLEYVAQESGLPSIHAILEKFETIFAVKKELKDTLDQSLRTLEATKQSVNNLKKRLGHELSYDLEQLQKVDYKLNRLASKNLTYETALNQASVEMQGRQRMVEMVLKSSQQMIENLIASGAIDKSYVNKTLAQQFEAIRNDYIQKKMTVVEYNRSISQRDKKRERRVNAHTKYGKGWVSKDAGKRRIEDLSKKRRMMAMREEIRKFDKTRDGGVSSKTSVEYDPFKDPEACVKIRGHSRITIHADLSDDEFDDDVSLDLSFLQDRDIGDDPLEEWLGDIASISPMGSVDMSEDSRSGSSQMRLSGSYSIGSSQSQYRSKRHK